MKREKYIELGFQSILIVFSVLFALFLNEVRQYQREQVKTEQMLSSLQQESKHNIRRLENVFAYHKDFSKKLMRYVKNDSLQQVYKGKSAMFIFKKLGKGLKPALVERTAWQIAQHSEQLENLDYELQHELSYVYNLQANGVESTWEAIAQLLTNPLMYDTEKSVVAIQILGNSLSELGDQEQYLLGKYRTLDTLLQQSPSF